MPYFDKKDHVTIIFSHNYFPAFLFIYLYIYHIVRLYTINNPIQ